MSVAELVEALAARGLTVAVAESLTGGLVAAELISVPGASAVVLGGVIAYDTELKRTLLGVDGDLLAEHGPVHPEVAEQMADRVRSVLAVRGRSADVGLATTGVAGPGAQGGHPAGTVYLGIAVGDSVRSVHLQLSGTRQAIREQTVSELLSQLAEQLA
ncbi:MAG: competence damage-inducible protein [Microbacteriaceae bacterium]|nr:competence damage-inducible protein [Microbacteriaceae bacterium]